MRPIRYGTPEELRREYRTEQIVNRAIFAGFVLALALVLLSAI